MQPFFMCPYCGGDPLEPNHEARCDGRQGGIEPDEVPTTPQDLDEARSARDHAIAEVEAGADESFYDAALETIHRVARVRSTFVIDDVWAARASWPRTNDKRAMGAAMLQAKRDRLIVPTSDFRSTAQVFRHAAPVRVWRSLVAGHL
jgi:hypothetical protein